MKFKITRTSLWSDDRPCKEAKKETFIDDKGESRIGWFMNIDNLEARIKELEEINKEEQKLNGELQKKLTYYEDICKGKSIQELGISDLYKED